MGRDPGHPHAAIGPHERALGHPHAAVGQRVEANAAWQEALTLYQELYRKHGRHENIDRVRRYLAALDQDDE
jgi:hypothetical protein